MFNLFRRKAQKAPEAHEFIPTTGGRTVYAVGDIHGRLDLLDRLLAGIRDDARGIERPVLVLLGDYVDRGPQSKGVIERTIELQDDAQFETILLKGNHEEAMMNFLGDPLRFTGWLDYGGLEALASFGSPTPGRDATAEELLECREDFAVRIEPYMPFLRKLKMMHTVGNHLFVHAGVRPNIELHRQSDEDLLWIRKDFLNAQDHGLPYRVVFGHTPRSEVKVEADRISVDTKAYASDILSAVRIMDEDISVLDTRD